MIQTDINLYNKEKFSNLFKKTDLYKKIENDYDLINFDNREYLLFKLQKQIHLARVLSPRKELNFRIFDAVPFYYLNYLSENNPDKIYDIGCGFGEFKKYVPNIVNIDHTGAKKFEFIKDNVVDLYDDLNENFYLKNLESFESAFAINSIHYNPLIDIRKIIIRFSSLILKGGKGFVALNTARMIEKEIECYGKQRLNQRGFSDLKIETIENFVRSELFDLPFKIEVFEFIPHYDCYLNGNVRIVFSK
jgi:SAM-dependent methyltransferase